MTSSSKLYIIVQQALSAGLKAAQACHALKAFGVAYPDLDREWYETSNNIVVLEYPDLTDLAQRLEGHGMPLARFHEPDRDGELTALCVSPDAQKLLAKVPLACAA